MDTINTKVLQLQSVINFMHELGYEYFPVSHVFQSEAWVNRGRKEVSLSMAIKLHNDHYSVFFRRLGWEHGLDEPFLDIPQDWVDSARKAKIVHVAKLQHSRRKGLIVQSHMVTSVNPDNAQYCIQERVCN